MTEKKEQTCPGCGMEKQQWQGNGGEGVRGDDGQMYCCEGCRDGTGCTCDDSGS